MNSGAVETVDDKKAKNLLDGKTITKYPFNGKCDNLIDKFLLLGYEQNYIEKKKI